MKIFTRCFVALLTVSTLLTLAPSPATAQIGPGMGQPSGPQIPPAMKKEYDEINKMDGDIRKLNADFEKTITPAQQPKMKALQEKFTKQAQAAAAPFIKKYGPNATPADQQKAMKEMQPTMLKLQAVAEKELKAILTAKQWTFFTGIQSKQKALDVRKMAFMTKIQASPKK
jgi:hypothetical protein